MTRTPKSSPPPVGPNVREAVILGTRNRSKFSLCSPSPLKESNGTRVSRRNLTPQKEKPQPIFESGEDFLAMNQTKLVSAKKPPKGTRSFYTEDEDELILQCVEEKLGDPLGTITSKFWWNDIAPNFSGRTGASLLARHVLLKNTKHEHHCVYVLVLVCGQCDSTPDPERLTYVGETPFCANRWRQHNGLVVGGPHETVSARKCPHCNIHCTTKEDQRVQWLPKMTIQIGNPDRLVWEGDCEVNELANELAHELTIAWDKSHISTITKRLEAWIRFESSVPKKVTFAGTYEELEEKLDIIYRTKLATGLSCSTTKRFMGTDLVQWKFMALQISLQLYRLQCSDNGVGVTLNIYHWTNPNLAVDHFFSPDFDFPVFQITGMNFDKSSDMLRKEKGGKNSCEIQKCPINAHEIPLTLTIPSISPDHKDFYFTVSCTYTGP